MKIYFYAPRTNRVDLDQYYSRLKRLLRQAGAEVTVNVHRLESSMSREDLEQIEAAGTIALETMDAMIIEATEADAHVGYAVAFAIAQQKPTLVLYDKRTKAPELVKLLKKNPATKNISIQGYLKTNLDEKLQNFLRTFRSLKVRENPNIKFTLRVTSTIEKYLHYKTHNTDLSKADFIREEIDVIMQKDKKFWNWLKKQQK